MLIDFGLSRHDQLPDLVQEEDGGPGWNRCYLFRPSRCSESAAIRAATFLRWGSFYIFWLLASVPSANRNVPDQLAPAALVESDPTARSNPAVPPWLQEIILRCLEVDPEARYATAAQLAFDLQHPDHVNLTQRADSAAAGRHFHRRLSAGCVKPEIRHHGSIAR